MTDLTVKSLLAQLGFPDGQGDLDDSLRWALVELHLRRQVEAGPEMLALLERIWVDADSRVHLGDDILKRVRAAIREAHRLPPIVFGKWVVSRHEEWFSSDEFDTKEEAVEFGPAELDLEPGEGFVVGRTADPLELGEDADPEWDFHIIDTEDHVAPGGEP